MPSRGTPPRSSVRSRRIRRTSPVENVPSSWGGTIPSSTSRETNADETSAALAAACGSYRNVDASGCAIAVTITTWRRLRPGAGAVSPETERSSRPGHATSGADRFAFLRIGVDPVALYPATQPKDVRIHLFNQGRQVRSAAYPKIQTHRRTANNLERSMTSRLPGRRTTGAMPIGRFRRTTMTVAKRGPAGPCVRWYFLQGVRGRTGTVRDAGAGGDGRVAPAAQLDDRTRRLRRARRHRPGVLREVLLPEPAARCRASRIPSSSRCSSARVW